MAFVNRSKRPVWAADRMAAQVKRRTGLSRRNLILNIREATNCRLIGSPQIVRERWIKVPHGRHYYFAVVRMVFQSGDGRHWSALRGQVHDADAGYVLSITGFWNLKPV